MQPTASHLEKDTSFWEVIIVTLVVGILGAIFIAGTFAWQEVQMQKRFNTVYNQVENNK
jgi:hypothetical protein